MLRKLRYFLVFLLSLLGLVFATSQHKNPPLCTSFKSDLKNFRPTNYTQLLSNNTILQDKRGIIYSGNLNHFDTNRTGNLWEFDGVSWRTINGTEAGVHSMAMDDNGTIYIGGYNEIGFLFTDSNGVLQYQSLIDQLENDQKIFEYVYYTHSTKEGIYFTCRKFLFLWDPISRKIKVWHPKPVERFLSSFKCKEKLYIHIENIGLMQMDNNKLELTPGGTVFKDKWISMMVDYNAHDILIGTRLNGLYLFDGTNSKPFPTKVDGFLKENMLNHGIRLSSGEFAIATYFGGLIIINSRGMVKKIFNKSSGLQDEEVRFVYEDFDTNLWLALETGVSRLEHVSPISINDDLNVFFYSIIKHNGIIYAGTEKGLSYLDPNGKFNHIPGPPVCYFYLESIDGSIFGASNKGLYQLKDNKINIIIEEGRFYYILHSKVDVNRIWVGGRNGLFSLYKKHKQWKKECHFENIREPINNIVEDKKGNLWLGLYFRNTQTDRIILKVDFPGDGTISSPVVTGFRITPHKLSYHGCYVFKAAGHIIFSTEKGLFRFDERNQVFKPDLTFGNQLAGGSKNKGLLWLVEDKNKNIWFQLKSRIYLAKPKADGSYEINSKPFRRIKSICWVSIYPDPHEDITWIGGEGKLIRYDTTIQKNYNFNFSTLIRRVKANGKLIYGGNPIDSIKGFKTKNFVPVISYEDRSLSFEFAAPFFTDESGTRYRYRLEGYENNWSDWGWETKKEYNSLPAGQYQFRVQSKNVYQHQGKDALFQFKILLPWHRTGWAFLSYAFVFLCLTYLIVKWRRSFQLEKEKQKLEQTVNKRTKEIIVKNHQLEEQSEKLKEMDKVKSRFFANISHEFRTPLTLIMGPLEQLLPQQNNKDHEKKINMALQNSQRLLGLINQLLDLSKLDSGKMKLQVNQQNIVPFIKGIISAFEPVAEKKELALSLRIEKEEITLYFDPEKLEHVVLNLLANAVKFTPTGGKITIGINDQTESREDFPLGLLKISVCDSGPGIPRNQLNHIFDRFFQAESADEIHPQGSGIGLALAKELVELHNGRLDIRSKEGQGSEFIIQLPLGNSHFTEEEIVEFSNKPSPHKNLYDFTTPLDIENHQNSTIAIEDDQPNPKNEATACNEPDAEIIEEDSAPPKKEKNIILVVEDNNDLRKFMRDCLEPLYEVQEAKNGLDGIQKAQEIIPDLIISDIMMPETDGYELCQKLKKDIKTSHIPIILLTAKASEENIIEGLEIGADDYITKPFSTKILMARIKNLIDQRRKLQLQRMSQMTLQPKEITVSTMDDEFYHELQEVIEKNLSDSEFKVEQLANKLYLSRSSLYRKILAISGETPQQFIRTYRLKRAAQLLKANFGNVTEVSMEVGFSNLAHFTQCFKKEFQQLPSEYPNS